MCLRFSWASASAWFTICPPPEQVATSSRRVLVVPLLAPCSVHRAFSSILTDERSSCVGCAKSREHVAKTLKWNTTMRNEGPERGISNMDNIVAPAGQGNLERSAAL